MTKAPGTIITFYSYKGGTGRSMSLANIAYILATHPAYGRKKVLMIDWDLEAPGLYRFFQDSFAKKFGSPQRSAYFTKLTEAGGLMEFLERAAANYQKAFPSGQLDESQAHQPDAVEMYEQIRHERGAKLEDLVLPLDDNPNLMLLKAGSETPDYPNRVRQFSWEDFYFKHGSFFTHFRQHLMDDYDYILIDSRTGLTDTSGICTRVMPEKLVGVFAPNFQNIEGLVGVVRRAAEHRRDSRDPRSLIMFPLASRIASGAEKLRKIWWRGGDLGDDRYFAGYQKIFENLFVEMYELDRCDLGDYFDATQIPHDNDYAFGEKVASRSEPGSTDKLSIGTACANLTERLVKLDAPWQPLPELAQLTEVKRQADEAGLRVTELESKQIRWKVTVWIILLVAILVFLTGTPRVRAYLWKLLGFENKPPIISPVNANQSSPATTPATTPSINPGPLKISASASSTRFAVQTNTYYAANAMDGKSETAWMEGADGPGLGEWIRFDFDREITIHRIVLEPGYFKSPQIWRTNNRLAAVTAQFSDGSSRELTLKDVMEPQKIDLAKIRTRWVRLVIESVYYGTDPDTALSEVAFEWEP